jgi:hypothetical protein
VFVTIRSTQLHCERFGKTAQKQPRSMESETSYRTGRNENLPQTKLKTRRRTSTEKGSPRTIDYFLSACEQLEDSAANLKKLNKDMKREPQ